VTLKPGFGLLRVIGTDTDRSAAYGLLLTFRRNYGPILYRFRDKRRFPSKTANFSHPRVFCTPTEWVQWELGIGARDQKLESWGYREEKKVWWYLQPSGYNTPTWRTDRRTDRRMDGHRATAKISTSVER